MKAMATARLEGGRGNVELIHARNMIGEASPVNKLNTSSGSAKDDVLQCHVYIYNLPIRQSANESLPLALDSSLIFIANTSVLFHSLLSQSDLDRGQPAVGSGWEVGRTNTATGR